MKNQQGFINGLLIIGIALFAVVAGAFALAMKSDDHDISADKQKASATVVIKRVADLVEQHEIKVANGETTLGTGFVTDVAADVQYWPKEAFIGSVQGTAVNEGSVTYITGISEDFCKNLNSVVQVNGIPTPQTAPTDRMSCVLAPEPAQ